MPKNAHYISATSFPGIAGCRQASPSGQRLRRHGTVSDTLAPVLLRASPCSETACAACGGVAWDLRLAVVVTVAGAAAVGVADVAVRRVPLLRDVRRSLVSASALSARGTCMVCARPGITQGSRLARPVSTTPRHAHTLARMHTPAETDRAPEIVAGSLAVPGAVGVPVGGVPHAHELGEKQLRSTHLH